MKKYPIIGPSSSGKTSLIKELNNRGFLTTDEVAIGILLERKNYPVNQEEIAIRQDMMFVKQLDQEMLCESKKEYDLCFLERGIHDTLGFSEFYLEKLPEKTAEFVKEQNNSLYRRYSLIFSVAALPFIKENRVEKDQQEAFQIAELIKTIYTHYKHKIIYVPSFPGSEQEGIKKRADYILEYVDKIGELK